MVGNCYDCTFFNEQYMWCRHAMHKVDPKLAGANSYCPSFDSHKISHFHVVGEYNGV